MSAVPSAEPLLLHGKPAQPMLCQDSQGAHSCCCRRCAVPPLLLLLLCSAAAAAAAAAARSAAAAAAAAARSAAAAAARHALSIRGCKPALASQMLAPLQPPAVLS
eukprot:TRINITY_DN3463_c0_g1_i2.p5 TRINITY_DN3463_c0_g1~~TRINITY_DN3463_c0_g1_i2.p5  ORF type:complete len:106 (-),score=46.81 TRINITY_DN3463_c0_g1_i2:1622-1939(-)